MDKKNNKSLEADITKDSIVSPSVKKKPKFSLALLILVIFAVAIPGIYLIYRSIAATPTLLNAPVENDTDDYLTETDPDLDVPEVSDSVDELPAQGAPAVGKVETLLDTEKRDKLPVYFDSLPTEQPSICELKMFRPTTKKVGPEPLRVTFRSVGNNYVNKYEIYYRYRRNGVKLEQLKRVHTSTGNFQLGNFRSEGTYLPYGAIDADDDRGYTLYAAKLIGYNRFREITTDASGHKHYIIKQMHCGSKVIENIKALTSKTKKMVKKATEEIGTLEGSARQCQYNKQAGLACGEHWCAAFASWTYRQIYSDDFFKGYGNSTSAMQNRAAAAKGKWIVRKVKTDPPTSLAPGDLLFRGIAHTGIVKAFSNGYLVTIDGNTGTPDRVTKNYYWLDKSHGNTGSWSYYARRMN